MQRGHAYVDVDAADMEVCLSALSVFVGWVVGLGWGGGGPGGCVTRGQGDMRGLGIAGRGFVVELAVWHRAWPLGRLLELHSRVLSRVVARRVSPFFRPGVVGGGVLHWGVGLWGARWCW
jgi:hypothetical protein